MSATGDHDRGHDPASRLLDVSASLTGARSSWSAFLSSPPSAGGHAEVCEHLLHPAFPVPGHGQVRGRKIRQAGVERDEFGGTGDGRRTECDTDEDIAPERDCSLPQQEQAQLDRAETHGRDVQWGPGGTRHGVPERTGTGVAVGGTGQDHRVRVTITVGQSQTPVTQVVGFGHDRVPVTELA